MNRNLEMRPVGDGVRGDDPSRIGSPRWIHADDRGIVANPDFDTARTVGTLARTEPFDKCAFHNEPRLNQIEYVGFRKGNG